MCTTFCQCPGTFDDEHYKQYKAIPAATYEKFDRIFKYYPDLDSERSDDIQVQMNRKMEMEKKELKWMAIDPSKEQSKIITKSMLECYNNTQEIALAIAKDKSQAEADEGMN